MSEFGTFETKRSRQNPKNKSLDALLEIIDVEMIMDLCPRPLFYLICVIVDYRDCFYISLLTIRWSQKTDFEQKTQMKVAINFLKHR